MTIEIRVPQLPESVSDATLVNWHRAAGDPVRRDEKLVELETDKVVLEVPSPSDGILQEVRVANGATVRAGEVLALLEPGAVSGAAAEHEEVASVSDSAAPPLAAEEAIPDAEEAVPNVATEPETEPETKPETKPAPATGDGATLERAGPAVRRLMREHRVDSSAIRGTGRGGRITKSDVLDYIERDSGTAARPKDDTTVEVRGGQETQEAPSTAGATRAGGASSITSRPPATPTPGAPPARGTPHEPSAPSTPPAPTGLREEQRVPMTRLRARIAERLVEAQHTSAMLTTFNEVDMSAVMDARSRYGELFQRKHGVKLGFMSFFIKACIEALRRYPVLNASVDGSDIIYHEYFDIGVAVSTDRGLVVPILRNAERMSYADIEKSIVDFGARARSGGLGMQDLTGGTFTLTNGGIFGSMMSTPIINPPQSGILGMHSIQQRPVVVDGEIEVRPMMYLALTYDHRIVDGREAVQFLVAIKDVLEDPARLLLQV